jgi:tetratricopeptide (TPR) repeat protein
MAKARMAVGLLAGCLLLGAAVPAHATPTVQQILAYHPRQEGVAISTPTPDEYARCLVKVVAGKNSSSGYVLLDPAGKMLRRFFDTNGDGQIDVWSYYKDGKEVYREIDSKFGHRLGSRPDDKLKARPDQYRWLHEAGMKWGVDLNEDGKIDAWKMISAQEAAQEAYQALLSRDYARLQALFLSENEMHALALPAEQADPIRQKLKQAPARFAEMAAKLAAYGNVSFVQVDGGVPHCIPADENGTERDLFWQPSRGVLFEYGADKDKKQEWMQTGRLLQVGMSWRLTEAPYIGAVMGNEVGPTGNPELEKLMEQLSDLDKNTPPMPTQSGPSPAVMRYNLGRADIVERIAAWYSKNQPAKSADWVKQLADNLSAAVQYATTSEASVPLGRLRRLKEQTVQNAPGSNLAGYITFRILWTEYNGKMSDAKAQADWMEKLASFVQTYPTADDTPDALMYLAMGYEFAGKDDQAKRCYKQLADSFPSNAQARKAEGSIRRLDLVGKEMELTGRTSAGQSFDMHSQKGKVVAVYYWASYSKTVDDDFAKLKQLSDKLGSKGFVIVTVDLDDEPAQGMAAIQKATFPATHIVADGGGLNGSLATQYGIMGVPSLFLVGRDGKVISRNLNMTGLEEALQKAL